MPVITCIEDLRRIHARRAPRMFYDYAESGSWTEQTFRENTTDFSKLRLRQRVAVDMTDRSTRSTMIGQDVAMPVALAPVGLTGMQHADGEILAARAAETFGVPFTLSTMSICSIEDVAAQTTKPFWFQLYVMKDEDFVRRLIERAKAAGCSALVVTLDLQILGQRHKDLKNGLSAPPKLTLPTMINLATKWRWGMGMLGTKRRGFGNIVGHAKGVGDTSSLSSWTAEQFDPQLDWGKVEKLRDMWGGKLILKGILDAEDAIADARADKAAARLRVVAPVFPRVSNHTDLDPLRLHPQVDFRWIGPGQAIPPADLVVLPGSKSVQADLAWLRAQGWEAYLQRHLRYGGKLLGICGGFQMLGQAVDDPHGVEGAPGERPGLGWLDIRTTLARDKQLVNVVGRLSLGAAPLRGYEIHMGVSSGPALAQPLVTLDDGRHDGALSADGQVAGTYVHGVLDHPEALAAVLAWAGADDIGTVDLAARREADLDRLADAVESHLDLERVCVAAGLAGAPSVQGAMSRPTRRHSR